MSLRKATLAILPILAAAPLMSAQQHHAKAPKSLRLYVFDCGVIKGLSPAIFGFKKEDLKTLDFAVPCYLVAHPKGTLMWDVGVIPDSAFHGDGAPVTQGISTATRPLKEQLAAIGYSPADITYLAMSHYHSDHTANANEFAASTWIVRQRERDAMFAEKPASIMQPATYSALRNSKTIVLHDEDYDVFGDGSVVIKSAPGHTPGHQVLFLKLPKTGPLLVAGDLYHYQEERFTDKVPNFEFNKQESLASRAAMEAFIKKAGARLWIEHDLDAFRQAKKAPQYYE